MKDMLEKERLITVSGKGEVRITPDVTCVELSLISLHDCYEDAYAQAKADTDRISEIMESVHLSKTLPKTTRLNIEKSTVSEYDRYKNYTGEKFLGFELSHIVKINLGMDNVILNKVVKGIGEKLKQAEITIGYTVKDPRPFQLKLLERAVTDAKEKAEIMSKAAGCRLGECISINYGVQELYIYTKTRNFHNSDEACCCNPESLDITPDDMAVTDKVDVIWKLEDI